MIGKVKNAVVGIRTKTKKGKILEGSGLIVASDGLMVTLAELVPQGSEFSFYINGERVGFQILKRDLKNNLALVKVKKTGLSTVGFADFSELKLGERIFLLGVFFEKGKERGKIVNEGIVRYYDDSEIQTNILEKEELSGSPLFDIEGNVLGLCEIDSEGRVVVIPISKVKKFIGF